MRGGGDKYDRRPGASRAATRPPVRTLESARADRVLLISELSSGGPMVTVLGLIGAALAGPALLLGGAFPGFGTLHGPSVPEPVTAADTSESAGVSENIEVELAAGSGEAVSPAEASTRYGSSFRFL